MVRHFIVLILFIMTIVSAVTVIPWIEEMNNSTNATVTGCVAVPTRCIYGNCTGGTCVRCASNPPLCCPSVVGRCINFEGVDYGICTPDCECNKC